MWSEAVLRRGRGYVEDKPGFNDEWPKLFTRGQGRLARTRSFSEAR